MVHEYCCYAHKRVLYVSFPPTVWSSTPSSRPEQLIPGANASTGGGRDRRERRAGRRSKVSSRRGRLAPSSSIHPSMVPARARLLLQPRSIGPERVRLRPPTAPVAPLVLPLPAYQCPDLRAVHARTSTAGDWGDGGRAGGRAGTAHALSSLLPSSPADHTARAAQYSCLGWETWLND